MTSRLGVVFTCFLLLANSVAAQNRYPDYQEIYVNDYAAIIRPQDETYIRDALIELREETGIEFTILTIQSMSGYGHEGAIEPFATGLFNYWGVGNAGTNDGVMMLIARGDRKMRIEVGSGYGATKNDVMKGIIDDVIIPEFKEDNYSLGIRKGVDAVIYDLTGAYPGEYDASFLTRLINRLKSLMDYVGEWALALIMPFAGGLAMIYKRWKRNQPRICPIDATTMSRLDEDWDDYHLKPGQKMEETLKSVDYDVWQCPKCDHITVEAYRAWFTKYGACRSCNFRTLEGETTILEYPTTSSEGLKRIDYHCHNCGDEYSATHKIPRKTKRSSSSSSSFGGGSSSGGGASGSW